MRRRDVLSCVCVLSTVKEERSLVLVSCANEVQAQGRQIGPDLGGWQVQGGSGYIHVFFVCQFMSVRDHCKVARARALVGGLSFAGCSDAQDRLIVFYAARAFASIAQGPQHGALHISKAS